MVQIKHFKVSEFDSKGEPGTGARMRISTLLKLDLSREHYGKGITIGHGFRTKKAAKRIKETYAGAVKNSAHEHGWAADIRPTSVVLGPNNWKDWQDFLEALWLGGFRRFGLMGNTVHVDDDPARPSPYIWFYPQTPPEIERQAKLWYAGKINNK